jgi:hypothetical protein
VFACLDRNRFAKHLLPDPRPKSSLGDDVNATAKKNFEVHDQATQIEQASSGCHGHDEIDVARFVGFATSDRTKHAHVRRAVLRGKSKNFRAITLQGVGGCHV